MPLPGQRRPLGGGEPAPWEPLDLAEAARRWRMQAEELHRLAQRHELLAHDYRQRAHHAEAMSRYFSGTGKWPKSVAEERGGGTPRPP
jgi:hypothetical protein